jgi:hypothetical protein
MRQCLPLRLEDLEESAATLVMLSVESVYEIGEAVLEFEVGISAMPQYAAKGFV